MGGHRGRPEVITEAYYRGLMHAVGYRRKDLDKPQIAVVNSWTDVNPGHQPLKELSTRVKEGIWAAGGSPGEFNVPESRIHLLVSEDELKKRQQDDPKRPEHPAPGMLDAYRKMVSGADSGAIWI